MDGVPRIVMADPLFALGLLALIIVLLTLGDDRAERCWFLSAPESTAAW